MDQKMMKTLGGIIAGFIIFILILFMIANCSKKSYTYSQLESKMMEVAKNYFEVNKKELPQSDKDSKTITLKKMISDGKIDEINKLFNDDVKCEGSITVTNNNGFYVYSPYLNCGKDYESIYLKDKIIEDSLVNQGIGLYKANNEYIMKGEVTNNYVSFANQLFRIIRINEDGTIRLFQDKGLQQVVWDNRYNPDYNYNGGINEYAYNGLNSRIKDTLEEYYKNSEAWSDNDKGYIVNHKLCMGKRLQTDKTKNGATECSKAIDDQPFGLLSIYEFLQASLDKNCDSTVSKSCRNYNWLGVLDESIWTVTADAENTQYVYVIYKMPTINNASSYSSANIVINITDKAVFVKGDGSRENPYVFK